MLKICNAHLDEIAQLHYQELKSGIEKHLRAKNGPLNIFLLKELKTVLSGKPDELKKRIIDKIPEITKRQKKNGEWLTKKQLVSLEDTFNYDNFRSRTKYGPYTIAHKLGLNTCPYCNRQYTFTLDPKVGKVRPEFDHFYNRATYPYLALSFYNLVPSCNICNSRLKGSENFCITSHIHPYLEDFIEDAKFRIELETGGKAGIKKIVGDGDVDFFYGSLNSFKIKLKIANPTTEKHVRINKNIEVFKLEELYNQHKDYVIEIVQKVIVYNNTYVSELAKQFPGLFHDEEDVIRMAFANYITSEELPKRVLSKLTKDILEDLKQDAYWSKGIKITS